jgi:hypothetical protein
MISTYNVVRWGVFQRDELEAPGYVQAINSWLAIDSGKPTPPQITITRKTMELAFGVSRAADELRSYFDGPGKAWEFWTEQATGIRGEIGDGWFYWALRDAAASAGWYKSPALAEEKYKEMASQIQNGFHDGRLKKRVVLIPFVDPDYRKWLPRVPASFITMMRIIVLPKVGDPYSFQLEENPTPTQMADFTKVVGRRNELPTNVIQGWVIAPERSRFGFIAPDGTFQGSVELRGATRQDVPGGFPFQIESVPSSSVERVGVAWPDGTLETWPLNQLRLGVTLGTKIKAIGIDVLNLSLSGKKRVDRVLPILTVLWTWVGTILALVIVAFLSVALWHRRGQIAQVAFLVFVLAMEACARGALFAMLDASSWNGAAYRYLFPVSSLFLVAGILAAWALGSYFFGSSNHTSTASGNSDALGS